MAADAARCCIPEDRRQPACRPAAEGALFAPRHAALARLHGIVFNVPDNFPVNSIAACRAYYWLAENDPGTAHDLALALYRGYFVDNRDLSRPETVVEAAQALGVDGDALVAALQDQAVKDRLRTENDAALERGVFGSPTVFVGDEMFWGHDRLEQIDRWLETGGW